MEKINVLYLDDEINNLNSFKAKFRTEYSIFIATNAQEAYHILENNSQIHVIISDQRMPDMTGSTFFESILTSYPDPIRILLTGYSDIASIVDAVNRGHIFRYLEKPWNDFEMQMTIENAYKFHFINTQLKSRNEELLKINEELNRFAYSASHDLKAPVKSMLGLLSLAKKEEKIDSNYHQLLGDSVRKLDYFISNIIDYYKNTRSDKSLNEIDFNKVISDSIEAIETSQNFTSKDITFDIDVQQEVTFVNDEFRIFIIISYLLSNAIKYQKQEESKKMISIAIMVSEKQAKISISDNGIGILEKYKESIYKMFFRGTTQSTGSGIGLYIVKETVDKLSGSIKVTSIENESTKFELVLPNEIVRTKKLIH